jgi:hypothetical protein
MCLGKTLFAQAMDFLPWKTFHRIVNRYGGDHRTRSLIPILTLSNPWLPSRGVRWT